MGMKEKKLHASLKAKSSSGMGAPKYSASVGKEAASKLKDEESKESKMFEKEEDHGDEAGVELASKNGGHPMLHTNLAKHQDPKHEAGGFVSGKSY